MKNPERFETLIARIEAITKKLDDTQTGIEESLKLYEEGLGLLAEAEKRLQVVEHTFNTLRATHDKSTPPESGEPANGQLL